MPHGIKHYHITNMAKGTALKDSIQIVFFAIHMYVFVYVYRYVYIAYGVQYHHRITVSVAYILRYKWYGMGDYYHYTMCHTKPSNSIV